MAKKNEKVVELGDGQSSPMGSVLIDEALNVKVEEKVPEKTESAEEKIINQLQLQISPGSSLKVSYDPGTKRGFIQNGSNVLAKLSCDAPRYDSFSIQFYSFISPEAKKEIDSLIDGNDKIKKSEMTFMHASQI